MKKIILASFFLLSIMSFANSRYVERCKVLDAHQCKSLNSGKVFHFGPTPPFLGNGLFRGTKGIVRITFEGEGYRNLEFIDWEIVE